VAQHVQGAGRDAGALPEPLKVEDTIRLTRAVTVRGGLVSGQEVVTYERDTAGIYPVPPANFR
jgi:hypothetical protein